MPEVGLADSSGEDEAVADAEEEQPHIVAAENNPRLRGGFGRPATAISGRYRQLRGKPDLERKRRAGTGLSRRSRESALRLDPSPALSRFSP